MEPEKKRVEVETAQKQLPAKPDEPLVPWVLTENDKRFLLAGHILPS